MILPRFTGALSAALLTLVALTPVAQAEDNDLTSAISADY